MEGEKNPREEPSTPKEPRQNPSVSAIFNTPELLQMILDYVIHDSNPEKSVANLRSVRLVDKSWLEAVTSLLHRKREPLFKLGPKKDRSVYNFAREKQLNRFVSTIEKRLFEEPFPTIKVRILEDACRQENCKIFTSFFEKCGHGLVELDIRMPSETGGFILENFTRDQVEVPLVKRISLQFKRNTGVPHGFTEEEMADLTGRGDMIGKVKLRLQALVTKAVNLTEFVVPPAKWAPGWIPLADIISDLQFPKTLSKLELGCNLHDEHLTRLVENGTMSGLTTLSLRLRPVEMRQGILAKTLDNLRKNLKSLVLENPPYEGPPRISNFVQFPVMEKLESLKIHGLSLELENHHEPLSQCLPKLKHLKIGNQSREMLDKWTENQDWGSVTKFSVQLVRQDKMQGLPYFVLPIGQEAMQRINFAFPNLLSLTLKLNGRQLDGLMYLFKEMKHLTTLKILACELDNVENPDYWDSVLVGAPGPFLRQLRQFARNWKDVELSEDNEPSIKQLTSLESLTLEQVSPLGYEGVPPPIISEVSFTLAFMKMPKLKCLNLKDRFYISEEVAAKWRASGRILNMDFEGREVMV